MELYLYSPQYVFMGWCLVKHRDNFTFTFFTIAKLDDHVKTVIYYVNAKIDLLDIYKTRG